MATMPPADSSVVRTRSGNRRDETARLAVLHAADDLLAEHGFSGLTIESIAREAGVAKQTIYRWWSSKVEILLDTLIEDSQKSIPVPVEKHTAANIRNYLRTVARFLSKDPAGKVFLALVAESQHNPETAKSFQQRYLDPRRDQERAMLRQATESGEVAPRLDSDLTMDMLLGPIIYRALTGAKISRSFVDVLFEEVLKPSSN